MQCQIFVAIVNDMNTVQFEYKSVTIITMEDETQNTEVEAGAEEEASAAAEADEADVAEGTETEVE